MTKVRIIKANGKSYKLEYSYNGFCDIEEASGEKNIESFFSEVSLTRTRLLLWGGLTEHQPDITVRDAGSILGFLLKKDDLAELTQMLATAVAEALPVPEQARPTKGK